MEWEHAIELEAGDTSVSPRASVADASAKLNIKLNGKRNTKKAADFMSYDSDHWVFRRFEKLSLFNILCLQQELVDCESRLNLALAEEWRGKKEDEIKALVGEIRSKLKEYETALHSQSRHKDFRRPSRRTLTLMKNQCDEDEQNLNPLREFSLTELDDGSDHVAIGSRDKTWIHRFVDKHECLRSRFAKPASEDAPSSLLFYSESGVRRAETIVINLIFCFLLLCPIVALSFAHGRILKLSVFCLFVLAASVLASDLSNAANKTNMAVIAGYAAILGVVMGNVTDS